MLSVEKIREVLVIARQELAAQFGLCLQPSHGEFGDWGGGFVNITLRRGGLVCGSMGGSGQTLPEAVRVAVQRASRDERFGRAVLRGDLGEVTIELWIETARIPFQGDPAEWAAQIRLGWDGVTVSRGASGAYYKPSVALTKSVATAGDLLARLCRKAKLPENAWRDPQARVERTEWIHAVEIGTDIALLEGLRPVQPRRAELETIRGAAHLCINHLLEIQKSDGSFGYLYHPFDDKWDASSQCVRLAGCAYAIARAAGHPAFHSSATTLSGAARRIAGYLLGYLTRIDSSDCQFVREPHQGQPWGKLGATALTALAALHAPEAFGRNGAKLIATLIHLQQEDGRFTCGIGREEGATAQNFFPGEAILALVCYFMQTSDLGAIRVLSRAFPYYKQYFYAAPTSAFVVWQADAWTRLAWWLKTNGIGKLEPNGPTTEEICSFVFDQVDWLLKQQYDEDSTSREEYVGGFKVPASPTASSAAFVEAITRALQAAMLVGDDARLHQYRKSAIAGFGFIMRLQVLADSSSLFARPKLVVGGITKSLESFEMRCDYDQHFLTACMTAMDVAELLRSAEPTHEPGYIWSTQGFEQV